MHTGTVDVALLRRSVLAVPPLARGPNHAIDRVQNGRLLAHLRAGGVTSFLYGGNANLYNIGVREFASLLDLLAELAQPGDWMIPSVGADFGKACD
jgi:4-hydroxy-tetrahydrodipicolinate synthase